MGDYRFVNPTPISSQDQKILFENIFCADASARNPCIQRRSYVYQRRYLLITGVFDAMFQLCIALCTQHIFYCRYPWIGDMDHRYFHQTQTEQTAGNADKILSLTWCFATYRLHP